MGDPKKFRKKYSTPAHPWNKTVIEEERTIVREFGLGNKKEILRASSFLKKYKDIAKRLIADPSAQAAKEKEQVLGKLHRLGLLQSGAVLDDILGLQLSHILERRLQSVIYRKGLARTMKQARQFITHRHILVGDKEITAPSYLLTTEEEATLAFKAKSTLADENHPERVQTKAEETHEEAEAVREATKKKTAKKKTVDNEDDLPEDEPVVEEETENTEE